MTNNKLYLLKFYPILKEKIWEDSKLNTVLNKSIPSDKTDESWGTSWIKQIIITLLGKVFPLILGNFPKVGMLFFYLAFCREEEF